MTRGLAAAARADRSSDQPKPQRTKIVKAGGLSYRPAEAAAVLGISRSTIYGMIADGTLEARKLGGATVIRHEELVRILDCSPLADVTKSAQASIR